MKKKIIALISIIAIFIPTYIAIAYYISAQNAPVAERTVESLTLVDVQDKTFFFDKNSKESKDMISFFINMNDTAKEVKELPDQLKNNDYYKATYKSYNKDRVYKYYFTQDPNEAYYVDARNNVFSITDKKAIEFLSMKYAESTYESAIEPELTVSNMDKLEPYTIDWKYKAGGGQFISTSYAGNGDASSSFPVSGNLILNFTNQPDYVNVKITNNNEVIFNDIYENLTTDIIGETTKTYNIEVNAKWYETAEKDYFGEANYFFTANVTAPASFYLGEDTVKQGEFVVITGKNIIDVNSIGFKSEPAINYTPVFYQEDDFVVALIPISIDLEYSPSYTFTLSSGGVTEELTLTVTERTTTTIYPRPALTADQIAKRTPEILNAFNNTLKTTVSTNESTRYWSSLFVLPVTKGVHWGFDKKIMIESTNDSFINKGVDYIVGTGVEIQAANKGKVVFVNDTVYSGKLVVIDHGYGLKSWYMNMGEASVNVGDIVEKGAVIGKTGKTGFSDFSGGGNLHYEITINGVHVSPYPLNEEGIKMYLGN